MNSLRRFLFVFGLVKPSPFEMAALEFADAQRALLEAEARLEQAKAHRDMLVARCRRLAQAVIDLNQPAKEQP